MIWAMLLAYSSFAACCAAQSSPDRDVYDENSASPYAHVEQTVDSHFQLSTTPILGKVSFAPRLSTVSSRRTI